MRGLGRQVPSRDFPSLCLLASHPCLSLEAGATLLNPCPSGTVTESAKSRFGLMAKPSSAPPNKFLQFLSKCRYLVKEGASQTRQVRLSLRKITTWHGNNTHVALTKNHSSIHAPLGPYWFHFLMQEKKEKAKQSGVSATRGGRPLATPRA